MAPKKRAGRPADTEADTDDKTEPCWDSSHRNLRLYLLPLKRWLPRQHPQLNNFIRYGYILNGKQEVVVHNTEHQNLIQSGRFTVGTFEKPFRMPSSEEGDSSDDEEASLDSGALTHPPSARKPKSKPTTEATTPRERETEDGPHETYKVAPKTLHSFDEEVLDTILSTFEDEDTADDFRDESQGSALLLLTLLNQAASKISTADDSNIEARQDDLYKEGFSTVSVKEFNAFKSKYSAFNQARRAPKSDSQLATDYLQVTSRLGDNIEARLDAKLDVTEAHGNLRKTIRAIREVLSKFEANQETRFLLHGKSAGAYLGKDPAKRTTNALPKKFDTSQPWKPSDGDCPMKSRGSGCDGHHWKKDCPNPNKINPKPPKKNKNDTPASTNPLEGKSNLARSEEAGAALFSNGPKDAALSTLDSPADLLKALTEGQEGRTCMARGTQLEESDSEEEDEEATDTNEDASFSEEALRAALYVAGPRVKMPLESESEDNNPPGVYYGSWGPPDLLSQKFSPNRRLLAVDSLLQATAACEQLDSPLLFMGPREHEGAVIGGHLLHLDSAKPKTTAKSKLLDQLSVAKAPTSEEETFNKMLAEIKPIPGIAIDPERNAFRHAPDNFWRNVALAFSCCACGGLTLLACLVVVLAFVLARERDPGEEAYSSELTLECLGLVPGYLCMLVLMIHGTARTCTTLPSSLLLALRRLRPSSRHGMGATSRPGSGLATSSPRCSLRRARLEIPSTNILNSATPIRFKSHREARHHVTSLWCDSIRCGAPPWISIVLLMHWPLACLFEFAGGIVDAYVPGRFSQSPLQDYLDHSRATVSWRTRTIQLILRHQHVFSFIKRFLYRLPWVCFRTWLIFRWQCEACVTNLVLYVSAIIMTLRIRRHNVLSLPSSFVRLVFSILRIGTYRSFGAVIQLTIQMMRNVRRRAAPGTMRPLPPSFVKSGASTSLPVMIAEENLPDVHVCRRTVDGTKLRNTLVARALLSRKTNSTPRSPPTSSGTGRRRTALMKLASLSTWLIVDSGCTYHCHTCESDLINRKECRQHMVAADGSRHRITAIGDMPLVARDRKGKLRNILLRNVRCVPTFTDTLISVDQLWEDSGVEARFAGTCAICLPTQSGHCALDLPFQRRDGLFQWAVIPACRADVNHGARDAEASRCMAAKIHRARATSHISSLPASEAAAAVHRRLHVNEKYLKRLPDITSDAPSSLKTADVPSCPHCVEANATHVPHRGQRYKPSHVGRLVHGDIVGPFVRSHGRGYQYMLVLVDDHSRYLAVRLLRKKSEALAGIRSFVAELNAGLNKGSSEAHRAVGTLHTDNAGEFLSKEFAEFLDEKLIDQSLCPPHVHQLNGTAERAIRSIMEQVRSNLVASGAPISFWPYAAIHSVDVLNRVRCPPNGDKSSYEILTGERPSIMDIMPFGCRIYAVKPTSSIRKTKLESHAWVGMNLGREPDTPGAYNAWIPDVGRKVVTSEAYFDEGLMPWRPKEDQRVGPVLPTSPGDHQPAPPPTLSGPAVLPSDTKNSNDPPTVQRQPSSLPEAYDAAVKGPHARARASRTVLLLFSGPKNRPDGLASFLTRLGLTSVMIDADPEQGGGEDDDLLNDQVFDKLLKRVQNSEFLAIIAAPPCSTFSICRFIKAKDKRGAPQVRSRQHIRGLPNVDHKHRRELINANGLVARTVAILAAAQCVGTQWVLENPADRGDPSKPRLWIHDDHGPMWEMPEVKSLLKSCGASLSTFPMCAFSAPWQKYTTLMYSAGFEEWLMPLRQLLCTHTSHDQPAGGLNEDGEWASGKAAAYPADFNLYLARAICGLTSLIGTPSPLARNTDYPKEDTIENRAAELQLARRKSTPTPDAPVPSVPGGRIMPPPLPNADIAEPPSSSPTRQIEFGQDQEPTAEIDMDQPSKPKKINFQRTLGKYPTRNRGPAPDRLTADRLGHLGSSSFRAFHAKPASSDPKTRREALSQDSDGWLSSERKEIENHLQNKTFDIIDRSDLPAGRKLVRWTWVYKWKRDGTQKSRLCVQGCGMVPGVDYDQTFCATMRSTSLRLLGALAAKFGLRMRRWDFVAAYLQGSLEEGEVVYCSMPPGYDVKGQDGQSRVCRILKPCYGMAQAGRRWQRALFPWLREWHDGSLCQTYGDSCVFHCRKEVHTPNGKRMEWLVVGAYVDDLCTLYSHDDKHSLYHKFTNDLQKRWAVEDEGDVSDLLGIDISIEEGHVCLRQSNYISRLATEFFPTGVPPTMQKNTVPCLPELPQQVLEAVDSKEEVDTVLLKKYQSLVGALLYCATNTRPDIAFAVGMLCRAMSRPSPALYEAAERVLAYLIRNQHIGLRYAASSRPLHGLTDSDWAVKHSTSGWVFLLSSAAISWGSKRQPSIALSSCEAEIIAASEAAKEAIYLKRFATELGLADESPIKLYGDNKGAIDLAYNPEHHSRTKHIDRRHFYIREMVENNEIVVPYVSTDENLADFFTKPLMAKKFFPMRAKLMNLPAGSFDLSKKTTDV